MINTDKEKVLVEIERLKHYGSIPYDMDMFEGVCLIESFINSLPADDIIWYDARRYVIEDNSKEQILCIKEDGLGVVTIGKIVSGTVRWTHLSTLINHGLLI